MTDWHWIEVTRLWKCRFTVGVSAVPKPAHAHVDDGLSAAHLSPLLFSVLHDVISQHSDDVTLIDAVHSSVGVSLVIIYEVVVLLIVSILVRWHVRQPIPTPTLLTILLWYNRDLRPYVDDGMAARLSSSLEMTLTLLIQAPISSAPAQNALVMTFHEISRKLLRHLVYGQSKTFYNSNYCQRQNVSWYSGNITAYVTYLLLTSYQCIFSISWELFNPLGTKVQR